MKKKLFRFWGFLASLNLHILLLLWLLFAETGPLKYTTSDGVEIEWVELSDEDKQDRLQKRQIVEQDENQLNEETPLEDYKLSRNDQRILRETKAANRGKFRNAGPGSTGSSQAQKQQPRPQNKPQVSKKLNLADFKPKMFNDAYEARKPASKTGGTGQAGSATDDYLKDVDVGAQTLLNTRRFVYYSYYSRIKDKLRQHWEPRIRHKIEALLRKGQKLTATSDKVTQLVITLNSNGELVRVQVLGASGYRELDEAAIDAFRAAAPFPNPPQGIVDDKGEIHINWDFVLES